jgi:hypothetical protein
MRRYFALRFVFAVLALAPATRAALVEYLPLHGNTLATVGRTEWPSTARRPTSDQNGTPNGALAFFPTASITDGNFVSVPGGGGLDGLQTGTIALWVKWTGIQDQSCCATFSFGVVTARQSNGLFSDDIIGRDADPQFAKLRASDRQAIREILVETKSGIPDYWRS